VGDQAAEIVARGARVIGIDVNEELLREAQSRQLQNAEFRMGDLRRAPNLAVAVDGIWCSFTAAYFPDFPAAFAAWALTTESAYSRRYHAARSSAQSSVDDPVRERWLSR
jgi:trans-aconitate methyltransferase